MRRHASSTLMAALLTILAVAGSAGAQDACLGGGSVLTDERQIAMLRADTETACPCADARSAGAWQRCAKGVLTTALDAGALRAECRKPMRALLKGTTCGSAKVPCGRIRDGVASCTPRKAGACRDTKKSDATACEAETACADVVQWTGGSCQDVRALGPFAPGFRYVTVTKDSVATPGTPRVLETAVWYPAPAGSGPITGAWAAVRDAAPDPSGGPYPVVLFSHGSCGFELQSRFLLPLLASRGFIVVAPPHVGNTIREFPDCASGAALGAAVQERPADMRAVLDEVIALGATPGSFLAGMVDGERVGMTGHSFGGLTTYLVDADPRVDVSVVMAPAAGPTSALTKPSLSIIGEIDGRIDNDTVRAAYERGATPKYLVAIEDAGHYAFSDVCLSAAATDCQPPATRTQPEANTLALRYIVPFLQVHLAGDERARALLETAVPGVALRHDP